jgi:hypothetical protein
MPGYWPLRQETYRPEPIGVVAPTRPASSDAALPTTAVPPVQLSYFLVAIALCPGLPRLERDCNPRADQLMPGDAFVARSFPSDTSLEIPYRPVPEQNHAE